MSWGKIYCDTNWGENKYRTAGSIINEATPDCFQFPEFVSFKDHVRSEGATYEKMQCGIDILLFLGRSISITPQSPDNPTFSGILDTYTGATAGYSTRRLTNTYTGGLIRVRRSSDDAEQDIGYDSNGEDLDTFGLLAFVNADVNQYTSDFSSTEDLSESNGTGAAAQSVGGVDDAYKLTCDSTISFHSAITQSIFEVGQVYNVSFEYYIPSGQTIDGIRFIDWGISPQSTLDEWVTVNETNLTSTRNNIRFFAADGTSITPSTNVDGDVFYLKNIVVTQTTADGHVTTWYDQTGNGNHATNSTASEQPLIVEAGDIIYEGATISRPAIDFDGVDDYLSFSTISSNTLTIIDVGAMEQVYLGGSLRYFAHFSSFRLRVPPINYDYDTRPSGQKMSFFYANGVNSGQAYNGGSFAVNALTDNINLSDISKYGGNIYVNNGFQELIIYTSDQSANRTGIEGNIDNYFRITS
jgi:hypothetical protein